MEHNKTVVWFLIYKQQIVSSDIYISNRSCFVKASLSHISRLLYLFALAFLFFSLKAQTPAVMTPLVWLVTGCSSGFGLEFVRSILARGDKVIATVRGNAHERLQHLKTGGAAVLSLDVDVQQAELDAKVKEAIAIYGGVDVLVNNAGYSAFGLVEDSR